MEVLDYQYRQAQSQTFFNYFKMATINNEWITLEEQRNGVTVERKYAGHTNSISYETNEVIQCDIYYWERELYPNGEVIKTERKCYKLMDLAETVTEEYRMAPLAVLSGFIRDLGQPFIVDAARETLKGEKSLPVTVPNDYPLHLDTREQLPLIQE